MQLRNWGLVKSRQFSSWRPVGPPVVSGKVYNARRVDEVIVLDIDAPREERGPSLPLVRDLADVSFMPFTAGGGVRGTDDVRQLLRSGADKVAFNTVVLDEPEVVTACAREFGTQCVVASVDARRAPSGGHEAMVDAGRRTTERTAVEHALEAERLGAGEILLTSIDEDGMMDGFDLDLIAAVSAATSIPVIACGGAGEPEHFVRAVLDGGADAVSAASIFHFTQYTPNDVKRHMKEAGIDVRL